jgi:hypothetical protein
MRDNKMSYQLILNEPSEENTRAIGDNIMLDDLPSDCKVYAMYYPGAVIDEDLESKLRAFGSITGKNLFVNIGRLDDPNYDLIINKFDITNTPAIVMTAISELASIKTKTLTAYVKIDNKRVFNSPELVVETVKTLFYLFMQQKIAEAIKQTENAGREAQIKGLKATIANALKGMKEYLSDKDVNVSLGPFSLEIKGKSS